MTTDLTGGAIVATSEAPQSPTETSAPQAQTPPKQKDPNEKRWAHMARQERQFRAQQAQFKVEREQFMSQKAEAEKQIALKQRISQGDYDALSEFGVTKEQLTNYLVNQPNPTDRELMQLKAKLSEMEQSQGSIQKAMEEQTQRNYDAAVKQYSNEIKLVANGNPDKYELINANRAHEAALELVKEVFDKEGHMMTAEEACDQVEEYLLEESLKLMNLKKIKAKFAPQTPPARLPSASSNKAAISTVVSETASSRAQPPRTLTHQQMPLPSDRRLTDRERRDKVVAAIQAINASKQR